MFSSKNKVSLRAWANLQGVISPVFWDVRQLSVDFFRLIVKPWSSVPSPPSLLNWQLLKNLIVASKCPYTLSKPVPSAFMPLPQDLNTRLCVTETFEVESGKAGDDHGNPFPTAWITSINSITYWLDLTIHWWIWQHGYGTFSCTITWQLCNWWLCTLTAFLHLSVLHCHCVLYHHQKGRLLWFDFGIILWGFETIASEFSLPFDCFLMSSSGPGWFAHDIWPFLVRCGPLWVSSISMFVSDPHSEYLLVFSLSLLSNSFHILGGIQSRSWSGSFSWVNSPIALDISCEPNPCQSSNYFSPSSFSSSFSCSSSCWKFIFKESKWINKSRSSSSFSRSDSSPSSSGLEALDQGRVGCWDDAEGAGEALAWFLKPDIFLICFCFLCLLPAMVYIIWTSGFFTPNLSWKSTISLQKNVELSKGRNSWIFWDFSTKNGSVANILQSKPLYMWNQTIGSWKSLHIDINRI